MIDNVHDLIKRHEGRRLKPYKCPAGKLTIGYGRNLDANGITRYEADVMLTHDVVTTVNAVKKYNFYEGLSDVRRAVVVDMAYNLGLGGLRSFVTFRKHLTHRDYLSAAREMMDSKWATQVPNRAKRLAKMMRTNEWPA